MPFIKQVKVRNFRCFRRWTTIQLDQATYLVGINNSGKTAFLSAIQCFFDDSAYQPEFLNRTEFVAKQEGYNRSDITITFDLTQVTGPTRKKRICDQYGDKLQIQRSFTFREVSEVVISEYILNEKSYTLDSIDKDIQNIIHAVSVSYIHPQEGEELLHRAQEKFKARLFHNWGRHASVADRLKELQGHWNELRRTANSYLSSSLTNNLKNVWPQSSTKVDLPERIEDIVAISDISFRSSPSLPEVTLTAQGTGAQSMILYQTHYILDSDRSLHQGFYAPVWLLEEPESFLHADISVKLGTLLNSDEWLHSIQMIISTHSPLILACSRQNSEHTRWIIFNNHGVEKQKHVKEVNEEDIETIGRLMGDPNFDAYFAASQKGPLFFIEDTRDLTKEKYEEAGLVVTQVLDGGSTVKKYVAVFKSLAGLIKKRVVFLLDNDKGVKEFKSYLNARNKKKEEKGFTLYSISENAYLLLMPKDFAAEDLFEEFDSIVEECVNEIFIEGYELRTSIPTRLSRAVAYVRRKEHPTDLDAAKLLIKNQQDVKDIFWTRVADDDYKVSDEYRVLLQRFINNDEN